MAKAILMCGKICAGKSTYAAKLGREIPAAVLSVDEITLSLFGQDAGEKHDEYVERLKKYLFEKAAELAGNGINVILDIGLWTKAERKAAREFFGSRGIENEVHYVKIPDDEWKKRIEKRNEAVLLGEATAYFVDEGLAAKASALFEEPDGEEIDVRAYRGLDNDK